ncbi:hypothetical protein GH789_12445 [Rhizobium pusense]|uniref:hypothetical protein n=1 Tax=Agrobacterium pusense TaxID=648995 RepID=UPI00129B2632|nr:hypothetical protein [Agrobacterium pusense]MRG66086.1 hypothetical protein [Agrobacterium pusense]
MITRIARQKNAEQRLAKALRQFNDAIKEIHKTGLEGGWRLTILDRAIGMKWERQAMPQPTGKTDGPKIGSSWLRRYIAETSGFWKAAVCFQVAFLVLMLSAPTNRRMGPNKKFIG